MPTIRLGTASPATQPTRSQTLALVSTLAQRASTEGIDLLLLPEAFLGGYPRGSAFGCVVGGRSATGRDEFASYFEQAVDLGDTVGQGAGAGEKWLKRELGTVGGEEHRGDGTREELERIATETGVFIVTGLVEKAGGSLYCAVVYVCPKLGIIGKRRKVMPTGTERLIWAQGSPSTLRAVTTTLRGVRVNLASAICWESYMPLLRQTLYQQNINLYLAPTADARDAWLSLMRTVGVEGRCFVLSSNMSVRADGQQASATTAAASENVSPHGGRRLSEAVDGVEAGMPRSPTLHKRRKSVFDEDGNEIVLSCPPDEGNGASAAANGSTKQDANAQRSNAGWACRGGSCIVDPYGEVLAGPQWEDDHNLIFADVDFRECIKGRLDLDAGGSYSRNDSFHFSVDGLDMDPLPY